MQSASLQHLHSNHPNNKRPAAMPSDGIHPTLLEQRQQFGKTFQAKANATANNSNGSDERAKYHQHSNGLTQLQKHHQRPNTLSASKLLSKNNILTPTNGNMARSLSSTPSPVDPPKHLLVPSIRFQTPSGRTHDADESLESGNFSDFDSNSTLMNDVREKLKSMTSECASSSANNSNTVVLPCRYRKHTSESNDQTLTSPAHDVVPADDDMLSREKDLGTALKWIRQEILEMKEQDKCLLKQFIELRASILQLRCLYDMHGSCSDVSSLDGSTYSLNEQAKSPRLRRLVLEGDYMNKPSISLPNSPRVARIKWRSDEYI